MKNVLVLLLLAVVIGSCEPKRPPVSISPVDIAKRWVTDHILKFYPQAALTSKSEYKLLDFQSKQGFSEFIRIDSTIRSEYEEHLGNIRKAELDKKSLNHELLCLAITRSEEKACEQIEELQLDFISVALSYSFEKDNGVKTTEDIIVLLDASTNTVLNHQIVAIETHENGEHSVVYGVS